MKFLLLVIDLICIHIYLDLISLHLTYLNFLRLSFLMQAWAFIQQFRNMRGAVNFWYSEMFGEYSILHVEYALLVTQ